MLPEQSLTAERLASLAVVVLTENKHEEAGGWGRRGCRPQTCDRKDAEICYTSVKNLSLKHTHTHTTDRMVSIPLNPSHTPIT